jgi:hypothetical protein
MQAPSSNAGIESAVRFLRGFLPPAMKATRYIALRFIADPHIPFLTMFLVLLLEFVLIVAKVVLARLITQAGANAA